MEKIQMVDLKTQYHRLKTEIDEVIFSTLESTQFIKGDHFTAFEKELSDYIGGNHVIPCANGTDALQIALMALNLKPGDEIIVPAFTYVATAEVIGLLGLKPVMIDVNPNTFNIEAETVEAAISNKTKAVVPVHLFGQCTDMETLLALCKKYDLRIIEDTAQAIGSVYSFSDGTKKQAGCMGDIGTTSFFPSKNLGCYGDGGAMFCENENLSTYIRMIANHGQSVQYVHDVIGVNSRLDGLQAGILRVKLKHLNDFATRRNAVAESYDAALSKIEDIEIPFRQHNSTHVFHQYTIKVKNGKRDGLKQYLADKSIPSMIYYPKPLHHQKAFMGLGRKIGELEISEKLCTEVLSLPIHTEMQKDQQAYIIENIENFFNGN
jgi:UDP-2-acetamido-2-deoxy-ribo-hexuluronate aminotransferase